MAFKGTHQYLTAVMVRFGTEVDKYLEFFRIFNDFNKQIDGDEIIRRTKELFYGEEIMVMGFYKLLLDQKRKTKKPDDFGKAFEYVTFKYTHGQSIMQKVHSSYADDKNPTFSCCDQRGVVKVDRIEDCNMTVCEKNVKYSRDNCSKLDSMQLVGERECDLASSSDYQNILTELPSNGVHMDKLEKAKHRDSFRKENINERKKQISPKWDRDRNERSDGDLPCIPSNVQSRKRKLLSNTENDIKLMPQCNISDRESFGPSYRLLSEKSKKLRESSHIRKQDASVLNNSLEYVSCVGAYPQKKTNQYEDMLIKVEDDTFEFDILFHSVEAMVKKAEEIIQELPEKPVFQMEEIFTFYKAIWFQSATRHIRGCKQECCPGTASDIEPSAAFEREFEGATYTISSDLQGCLC